MEPGSPTVLIVDDDPSICAVMRDVMEAAGHRVEVVHDGVTALARIRQGGVDLVLLDLMIPGIDGREVCRQVRAQVRGLYLPIIMVTALGQDEDRHAGFAAGADDYVTKPFTLDDLLDRVGVWLRMRERLRVTQQQRYADTEAALLLARTPLQMLVNLVRAWEAKPGESSDVARVRAELEETAQAVSSQMDHLNRLLRAE